VALSLTACGSAPVTQDSTEPKAHFDPAKDSYWQNPRWDMSLIVAVQAAIHNPVDPADTSTPDLHGTVQFTYLQGVIEYPEVVTGTGHPDMDELMLHQLASVKAPQASGIDSDKPHEFVLDVDMHTPFESFQDSVNKVIDDWKLYPKDAVLAGDTGTTVVSFDYLDGTASNIAVAKSSGSHYLDKASVGAITKAKLPLPPTSYAGKVLHMESAFCYSLRQSANSKDPCPAGETVIEVTGTRIRY
jgi:hypothetical protein